MSCRKNQFFTTQTPFFPSGACVLTLSWYTVATGLHEGTTLQSLGANSRLPQATRSYRYRFAQGDSGYLGQPDPQTNNKHISIFICASMLVYVCMVHVCAWWEDQRLTLGVLSQSLFIYVFETDSLTEPRVHQLARLGTPGLLCLCLPSAGVKGSWYHARLFMQILGI